MKNWLKLLWTFIILPEIIYGTGELFSKRVVDTPRLYRKVSFSRGRNSSIPTSHYGIIYQRFERLMDTIEIIHPRPLNSVVFPYGGIDDNHTFPFVATEFRNSPYQSDLHINFHSILGWNDDEPVPQVESNFGIRLQFNTIWFILQIRPVQYGNNRVFRDPVKGVDLKQYPRYNGLIVMSMPGKKLPWRPASRREYLENAIAEMNYNKHLRDNSLQYKYSNLAKNILNEMSEAELSMPAYLAKNDKKVIEFFMTDWKGFRKAGDIDAEALVFADDKFFDNKMPKTSIQLIAIGGKLDSEGEKRKEQIRGINGMLLAPGVLKSIYAMLSK